MIPLQFYQSDEYLEQYEEFFNEHKSAFVPTKPTDADEYIDLHLRTFKMGQNNLIL